MLLTLGAERVKPTIVCLVIHEDEGHKGEEYPASHLHVHANSMYRRFLVTSQQPCWRYKKTDSVFMQIVLIVLCLQHGCCQNTLLVSLLLYKQC